MTIIKHIKKSILLLLFLIISNSCSKKVVMLYPPNTLPFTPEKYIDKSYIECLHVLEFLYNLKKDPASMSLYKKVLPKDTIYKFEDWKMDYSHPAYRLSPMPVSINFAKEYCKWRSEVVTYVKNFGKEGIVYSEIIKRNKKAKIIIRYSIPTKEDLELANNSKSEFKDYENHLLKYEVMTTSSSDTNKLFFLRSIATMTNR